MNYTIKIFPDPEGEGRASDPSIGNGIGYDV